jgi:hypothetical protein
MNKDKGSENTLTPYGKKQGKYGAMTKGIPATPYTLEQLQYFLRIAPIRLITRETGLSNQYINKVLKTDGTDIFTAKPVRELQSYVAKVMKYMEVAHPLNTKHSYIDREYYDSHINAIGFR